MCNILWHAAVYVGTVKFVKLAVGAWCVLLLLH